MPGVPSNKACDQCKKRHVKCDEGRPSCQKCTGAGIECPGYSQDRKFIDEGASVRRRYAPYRRAERPHSTTETNETPVVSDEDMGQGNVASLGPASGHQADNSTSENLEPISTGLNLTQTVANGAHIDSRGLANPGTSSISQPQLMMQTPSVPANGSLASVNMIGPSLSYETNFGFPWEASLGPSFNQQYTEMPPLSQNENEFENIYSELLMNSEREMAFLIRHYTELLGPCLDLHDSGNYFSLDAPRRALHVPFIQSAISAVAAKHLSRTGGSTPSNVQSVISKSYPNMAKVDWSFKASNYYFQSLSYMIQLVTGNVDLQQTDVTVPPIRILCQSLGLDITRTDNRMSNIPTTVTVNVEDILCGTVILTVYDIIDAPGLEWESRLSGIKTLLESPMFSPGPQRQLHTSHAMYASFWNLAYFDYLASYANRRRTQIDPSNLDLFRSAGLPIDNQGKLQLRNFGAARRSQVDETFSHGLTFLFLQLMNFIAEFKEMQQATMQSSTPPDISLDAPAPQSSSLTATWRRLSQEVENWRNALPDTFKPYLCLEDPRELSSSIPSPFPEIVFSTPSHAATVAHYNFARIVLLLNRPHDAQSTPRDRLLGYREVTKEVDGCLRTIAGISMGKPPVAVQAFMLHPLFVVGQCDDRPEARRKVVELLQGIRTELGWETDYRLKQLYAVWDRS
ncbi:putative transcriptional regulatory protein C11D3,07c [Talaromyces islandicus]|uniref:Putative transcriptional regulatory protein C11D3,07c n=1 Tax=Talaromyces islandicus TaxID=28573 RepID=A0A0U1M6Z0_TALIS|nr:putative transcriptional regulatory protein C11D3,07c [Talaromyces islandicus]